MEPMNIKMLGKREMVQHHLKRKRDSVEYLTDAEHYCLVQPATDQSSLRSPTLNGGKSNNSSVNSGGRILHNYRNFLKSGLPHRVLSKEGGKWIDFPANIISLVQEDFRSRKSITEADFQNRKLVMDFVHLVCIDLGSEYEKPIGWIDEHGSCFFPEPYPHCYVPTNNYSGTANNLPMICKTNGVCATDDHFEISVGAAESSTSGPSDEVMSNVKMFKSKNKSDCNQNIFAAVNEMVGENEPCSFPPSATWQKRIDIPASEPCLNGTVQDMIVKTLSKFMDVKNIIGILRIPMKDDLGLFRSKHFQEQVEITKQLRGNANVRYAWLASTMDILEEMILKRTLKKPPQKTVYDNGIDLAPAHCPNNCYSDVQEQGVIYMMLCRVIMGNPEVILPGSQQYQPSNENYDSGVDDIRNPKHYIIWDMNIHTHIYAEFIVTLKVPPKTECLAGKDGISNISAELNNNMLPNLFQDQIIKPSSALANQSELEPPFPGSNPGVPIMAPWMPFSMLFAAISTKISSHDMDLVNTHYQDYKKRKISRIDLIKNLRLVAGDQLLISTILRLQEKLPVTRIGGPPNSWRKNPDKNDV